MGEVCPNININMKIIHLPTSVGGNSWGLSRGERLLGLESDVLDEEPNWLEYPCDIHVFSHNSALLSHKYIKKAVSVIKKTAILYKLLKEYDVFHFNFGKTLFDWFGVLNNMELPVLKGKKICVTYNGCDARQKYKTMDREEICCCKFDNCYNGICNNRKMDRIKEKRIEKFKKYNASFFALNPDLMHYLPEETVFLPYTISRWNEIEKVEVPILKNKTIKVVHAPTDRVVKGSDAIIKAVDNINKKRSDSIELDIIEKMSNEEAIKRYSEADIIIDQLRVGWYGAFAVEAMKMGKPIIAYINTKDLKYIPHDMASDVVESIINANEFTIENVLTQYLENRKELKIKQEAQLDYVNKWHNPLYVASITKKEYEK